MPELTTKQWIENSTPEMLDQLRSTEADGRIPPDAVACQQDPNWWKLFCAFADKAEMSGENVDFLAAVDKFKKQPTVVSAQEICQKFVRRGAPNEVNLAAENRKGVTQWFDPDVFEVAYNEISGGEDPDRDGPFRLAVENWRARGRYPIEARTICDDHVRETAVGRVNLTESTRTDLLHAVKALPDTAAFFDAPYREIFDLIKSDTYPRFKIAAGKIKPALEDAPQAGPAISRPGKLEAPQGRVGKASANKPDPATVKTWNEKALNVLKAGDQTDFFQVGELVVVANSAAGMPPGVVWLQQQEAATGTITMTKKGGAFDPGSIKAEGVSDQDAFKKAIAIFSKKRVEYA
jgi:hypothetical protein